MAERKVVEEFLGQIEGQNFLADRLETPMLINWRLRRFRRRCVALPPFVGRPKRRPVGMVVRWDLAQSGVCYPPPGGGPAGGAQKSTFFARLGGRTRRLADGTAEMAPGRRPGKRRQLGTCLSERHWMNPSGSIAACPADLSGRSHSQSRRRSRQPREPAASGIYGALSPAICGPAVVAGSPGHCGFICDRSGHLFFSRGDAKLPDPGSRATSRHHQQ